MQFKISFIAIFFVLLFSSCKKAPQAAPNGTYWSIIQFTKDQWSTFKGQPYTFERIIMHNGKRDSIIVSAFDIDWGSIFHIFFATDIGDPKYLDHYTFTTFTDDITETINFYYEAKDNNLFTRKLQISADEFTKKIRNIYIETQSTSGGNDQVQKLYYSPLKIIQIQQVEKAMTGRPEEMKVEYRFL